MTTFYHLVPSNRQAPTFTALFDGAQYIITVLWNISSQRFYVNCKDISGNLIFMVPLVINPESMQLASLSYDEQNMRVVATTVAPHNFPIGEVINASIINCVPSQYNGSGLLSVLSKTEIIYSMKQNPGPATTLGAIDYLISLTKGYFRSTMIYRDGNFEINP
jgi:hypothetical protein